MSETVRNHTGGVWDVIQAPPTANLQSNELSHLVKLTASKRRPEDQFVVIRRSNLGFLDGIISGDRWVAQRFMAMKGLDGEMTASIVTTKGALTRRKAIRGVR